MAIKSCSNSKPIISSPICLWWSTVVGSHLDRYDEALDCCAKATRNQSGDFNPQVIYASVLGQMGRIDEARQQLAAAMAKELGLTASRILPTPLHVMFEEGREKFTDGLRKAGLPE